MKFDPNIKRKSTICDSLSVGNDFLPSIVEFSTSGLCNRKCIFCPRSSPDYNHINEHLSVKNLSKISNELMRPNTNYYFIFSGFSEPLLTPHLPILINILRSDHPTSTIEINTNTDLLSHEIINSLFDNGISSIICSIYDSENRLNEVRLMFQEIGYNEKHYKLRSRFYNKSKDEELALDEFGITLSNRGGSMSNAGFPIATPTDPLSSPCYYPFYNMFIDYNGDYLLCPHDWSKQEVLGNISTHNCLNDIWHSDRLDLIRKNLLGSNRKISAPCSVCDVRGTLIGEKQVRDWQKWIKAKMS